MWFISIIYLFSIIPKCIAAIKSLFITEKDENYVYGIVEMIGNIATFFVLFFVAMECIGVGIYISIIVMCLCDVYKRSIDKRKAHDTGESSVS